LRTIRDAPTHSYVTSNGAGTTHAGDASMPLAFTDTQGELRGRDGGRPVKLASQQLIGRPFRVA